MSSSFQPIIQTRRQAGKYVASSRNKQIAPEKTAQKKTYAVKRKKTTDATNDPMDVLDGPMDGSDKALCNDSVTAEDLIDFITCEKEEIGATVCEEEVSST